MNVEAGPAEVRRDEFHVSAHDFLVRARRDGWPFWRGMMVGFAAGFPLAYFAIMGRYLPG